jgi:hypothetical protein
MIICTLVLQKYIRISIKRCVWATIKHKVQLYRVITNYVGDYMNLLVRK